MAKWAHLGPCGDVCGPSSQPLAAGLQAPRPAAVDPERGERVLGGAGVGAGICGRGFGASLIDY
jgi:hypothetical protein